MNDYLSDFPIFPDVKKAKPEGLIAINGKLTPNWLITAYSKGIFPWFSKNEPIMWWSPDPRAVMSPKDLIIHKSMQQVLKKSNLKLKIDFAFEDVIRNCSKPRTTQPDTWIVPEMIKAYTNLHKLGYAHSFETWKNNELVGGLYGISIGRMFFGESMFSFESNASKYAFIKLCQILENNNFSHIDCQQETNHMKSLGCKLMSRSKFLDIVEKNNEFETIKGNWSKLLKID